MAARNKFADLLNEVGVPPPPGKGPGISAETKPAKVGKRSDPEYRQISTYARNDLYKSVRRELMNEERDFSDLLDELLESWLKSRLRA